MDDCYYLDATRNQQGPVPADEIARLIRSGTIRRDTLIWHAGMPDWRPVGQVDGFASLFARAAPPRRPVVPSRESVAGAAPSQRMAPVAGVYSDHIEPRMGFGKAIATCFSKYVDFTGRARRKEYWFWHLFYWLVIVGLLVVDAFIAAVHGPPVLTLFALLGLFLPTLAGTVRRLHDTDHSGWMMFVSLIPLVGGIIFLVFMCQRGTTGPNRFGEDPLAPGIAAAFD
jgi:uncharacterized membrane protein YhaH (DUF805 family)